MLQPLTFDETAHEYRAYGVRVPSVTQIIRAVIPFPYQCDRWYLQRGTMVHKAVAMMLRGDLDWDSVDPRIQFRVMAAQCFAKEFADKLGNPSEFDIECRQSSPLGFAGTPDLYANGLLVDWKSSDEPETEIQLGGYCCFRPRAQVKQCMSVELREDGNYSIKKYVPARCAGLFLNVFSVYQWMAKNGRLPKQEG
jgi:hypothetical protein